MKLLIALSATLLALIPRKHASAAEVAVRQAKTAARGPDRWNVTPLRRLQCDVGILRSSNFSNIHVRGGSTMIFERRPRHVCLTFDRGLNADWLDVSDGPNSTTSARVLVSLRAERQY